VNPEEIERYARIMARNLEDGDSRMLRENIACLLFRAKNGRDPSWEELPGAFDALKLKGHQAHDQ
jgi:hypothetical protein